MKRWKMQLLVAGTVLGMCGCGTDTEEQEKKEVDTVKEESTKKETARMQLTVDDTVTYQTMESFGVSGAWWSQDVGGWTDENEEGVSLREEIATLFFDREKGIGLSSYRYNIGAGSKGGASEEGISQEWRVAESFEVSPGVYDWSKDENAVWFLTKARDMGVSELIFFCNSPLERLTRNGKAYGEENQKSNLAPEQYQAFSKYVLDVTEHFIEEGYPVRYVSPVNEPQWDWIGGQEGCHFEPQELVDFYHVFLEEFHARNLTGLELSAPELGEWGNTSYPYYKAILQDEILSSEITSLDVHSYWSDEAAKKGFADWIEKHNPDLSLKMSEWCEMKNGVDTGMDSALHLAEEIMTDLTVLDVTSWQYWIGVSAYNYRDGLVYVNPYATPKTMTQTKRLWAMGNFSRFIRPGYQRVACNTETSQITCTAMKGEEDGKEQLVVVVVNSQKEEYEMEMKLSGEWTLQEIYTTDATHSLEQTEVTTDIRVAGESVTTFIYQK